MSDCKCKARRLRREREAQLSREEKVHGVVRTVFTTLGIDRVPSRHLQARLAVCDSCPNVNKDDHGTFVSCLKCGCRLPAKAKDARETCCPWEEAGV